MATMATFRPFTIPVLPALGPAELEKRFTRLLHIAYNTSVPVSTLQEEVYPYLAPDIELLSPWLHVRGAETYKVGLSGARLGPPVALDVVQLSARFREKRDAGRVFVDAVLKIRLLPGYTLPLRTFLTLDFVLTECGESFQITRHEEMWSFADILHNAPLAGRWYETLRAFSGYVVTGALYLACAFGGRRRRCAPPTPAFTAPDARPPRSP